MKYVMAAIFSTLLLASSITGAVADEPKKALCTAKDVQHNINLLRESIGELKATHDHQRGMEMLHNHMAMLIDNQEIILGLLDKKDGVECPKTTSHIKK